MHLPVLSFVKVFGILSYFAEMLKIRNINVIQENMAQCLLEFFLNLGNGTFVVCRIINLY